MLDPVASLRWWMAGPQARALARAAGAYWSRCEDWLQEALAQADIATCSAEALRHHARDRQLARLPGEPETVWRKRVQKAITAAIHAGSKLGLETILRAHGVTAFAISERIAGQDWDVVLVELDPAGLQLDSDDLNRILVEWGRVCRRYTPGYTMAASAAVAPLVDRATFYFASAS